MSRYTHFRVTRGEVDLIAGDITECGTCGRVLYRDYRIVSSCHPDPSCAVNTLEAQLELGRTLLPADAEAADEDTPVCAQCSDKEQPMRLRYLPEVVDAFENTGNSEVAQAIRDLVADGFLGYHVEPDDAGGVRLRYFALRPRTPDAANDETWDFRVVP